MLEAEGGFVNFEIFKSRNAVLPDITWNVIFAEVYVSKQLEITTFVVDGWISVHNESAENLPGVILSNTK